jgi:hypothetical protein
MDKARSRKSYAVSINWIILTARVNSTRTFCYEDIPRLDFTALGQNLSFPIGIGEYDKPGIFHQSGE